MKKVTEKNAWKWQKELQMFMRYHLKKTGKYSVSRLEDDSRLLQSVLTLQAHPESSDTSTKIKGIAGLYAHAGPMQATKLDQIRTESLRLAETQLTHGKVQTAAPRLPARDTSSPFNNKLKGWRHPRRQLHWSTVSEPGKQKPPVPSKGLGCLWGFFGGGWTAAKRPPVRCSCPHRWGSGGTAATP